MMMKRRREKWNEIILINMCFIYYSSIICEEDRYTCAINYFIFRFLFLEHAEFYTHINIFFDFNERSNLISLLCVYKFVTASQLYVMPGNFYFFREMIATQSERFSFNLVTHSNLLRYFSLFIFNFPYVDAHFKSYERVPNIKNVSH